MFYLFFDSSDEFGQNKVTCQLSIPLFLSCTFQKNTYTPVWFSDTITHMMLNTHTRKTYIPLSYITFVRDMTKKPIF